jgi:hypothetical protein
MRISGPFKLAFGLNGAVPIAFSPTALTLGEEYCFSSWLLKPIAVTGLENFGNFGWWRAKCKNIVNRGR